MTELLYRENAYRKSAKATVTGLTEEGGVILDRSIFYARGGGQPGDSGRLTWEGGKLAVATAVKGDGDSVILVPAEASELPLAGAAVDQHLDWDRRFGHMRIHTALHLLSVVMPYPVTGGAISSDKGRLDFDMSAPPEDKAIIAGQLNMLIERGLDVTESWISETELDANPGLVKTMSVSPPRGAGSIRLVRIGPEEKPVDLQPCGGTHVANTAEIGRIAVTKVENKGKRNRRVTISLES